MSFKEGVKATGKGFGVFIGIIALVFILGIIGLVYRGTIGKANVDMDREIFEHSQSHIQGLTDDLAKYKFELSTEKDAVARKAIIELIVDRFSTLDPADLEDPSLAQFLKDVRNGQYNEEN